MDTNIILPGPENEKALRYKKIRNILIIILAAAVIVGVVVFYVLRSKNSTINKNLFPVSPESQGTNNEEGTIVKQEEGSNEETTKQFQKIYPGPVAGYIKRENGNILLFDNTKGILIEVGEKGEYLRSSINTPLLYIHDVLFINENQIITRMLDNQNVIKSKLYTISGQNDNELKMEESALLADNILEYAVSENGTHAVFVIKDTDGSHIDTLRTDTHKIETVFKSPISEWIPSVHNNGNIFLTSKASSFAESGVYAIVKDKLQIVSNAETAKTSLFSPDGTYLFTTSYNTTHTGNITSKFLDDADTDGSYVEMRTIADKCGWKRDSKQILCAIHKTEKDDTLDNWYMGKTHKKDIFRFFNIEDKSSQTIIPETNTEDFDAVSIIPEENRFYFVNRKDLSLWSGVIPFKTKNEE